jgi:hypothetical protein
MEDLKFLTLADLLELMIEQTKYHTYLLGIGASPEQFKVSGEILSKLQSEIKLRKSMDASDGASSSTSHDHLSSNPRY